MRKKISNSLSSQEYLAVFEEEKNGGFSVWIPDLPGCASQGETIEEAIKNIKEAIELYLEDSNITTIKNKNNRQFIFPIKISSV